MKTAISLPDSIYEEAEQLARRLGMTRSGLYATAVADFVRIHRQTRVTEALNTVYAHASSEIDESWLIAGSAGLDLEDW